MKRTTPIRSRREAGIAMLLCLFALLLLTTIGMGLMFMSKTETSVNSNYRAASQAYYAARAGLEEGRERLRYGSKDAGGNLIWVPPPLGYPSSTNSNFIRYITNTTDTGTDAVGPADMTSLYKDDEICNEPFFDASGNSFLTPSFGTPCSVGVPTGSYTAYTSADPGYDSASAMKYKWVRITQKQNCTAYFGVDPTSGVGSSCTAGGNRSAFACADPNDVVNNIPREKLAPVGLSCDSAGMRPVYTITSMASWRNGPKRMAQMEVANVAFPQFQSALLLDGSGPTVSFPSSNTNGINGNDQASGTGCTAGPPKAAIGIATVDPNARTYVIGAISQPTNYPGYGGAPSVSLVNDGTSPALNHNFRLVRDLQALSAKIISAADQTYGSNPTVSAADLGTDPNPKITYINGDFTFPNDGAGAGILLVSGALYGSPNFHGVVLAIGHGYVSLSGGNGNISGAMLIANLYDQFNNPLDPNSPPGKPYFQWTGGGSSYINYDSCWINKVASRFGYQVIAEHEKMY